MIEYIGDQVQRRAGLRKPGTDCVPNVVDADVLQARSLQNALHGFSEPRQWPARLLATNDVGIVCNTGNDLLPCHHCIIRHPSVAAAPAFESRGASHLWKQV